MRRTKALAGVRMIEFMSVFGRWAAAELLGMSERTFRRWSARYEEDGEKGLLDRQLDKASGERALVGREAEVAALCRSLYQGSTAKHFHEHLVQGHHFGWDYTWKKTFLQSRGFWSLTGPDPVALPARLSRWASSAASAKG